MLKVDSDGDNFINDSELDAAKREYCFGTCETSSSLGLLQLLTRSLHDSLPSSDDGMGWS